MSGLDPEDWSELRALGHVILDDMFDRLEGLRDTPVWQRMPDPLRMELHAGLPRDGMPPGRVYDEFRRLIAPYSVGNTHPRFMGWVHGGGTGIGMLAELLAGGLNANLGGRDHAPIEVERQVVRWAAEMVGMPADSAGLLVTGSSIANMIALLVARRHAAGPEVRTRGVGGHGLVGYAGHTAHGCVPRAFDMAGLGSEALRQVACDAGHRISLPALEQAVAADRAAGLQPFLVVGTAGAVDTGAVDDLAALAAFCREQGLWFHVDGAFGALAALSPRLRGQLAGIGEADSLAFDFHKWAQAPYDAGCVLIRDPALQTDTFRQSLAYLAGADRGVAANAPWPADLGPDLSRGFRALKVWMTLKTYGADRMARMVEDCCDVALHLAARIEREPTLELLAPVNLNIVCFRLLRDGADLDFLNGELVKDLHEAGIAVPSITTIDGRRAIRAAIVNHRTIDADVDAMIDGLLMLARRRP